jgi:hypothetical protein
MKPSKETFTTLLIISEIVIPLIVFIGAYLIFRPLLNKRKREKEEEPLDSSN